MASQHSKAYLVFTVGPVQGFVGQARRTRDLWAGSWLLSFLSETALAAAEEVGGIATVPYRKGLERARTSEKSPIGGYPNLFKMEFPSADLAAAAGSAASKAYIAEWKRLAEEVWVKFIRPAENLGLATREIWLRQIEHFWELSWVVADSEAKAGRLAAARKNFRNVPGSVESGFKCSLMGTHQEISGHFCKGSPNRQKLFWAKVRSDVPTLDLKESERLCAVALIKRLYPRVFRELNQVAWPSTAFVAAQPWLKSLTGEEAEAAVDYAQMAIKQGIGRGEEQAAKSAGVAWANLDAQAWYETGLRRDDWELGPAKLEILLQNAKNLKNGEGKKPLPFYALLVMDGDSMGKLLNMLADPSDLSRSLKSFADSVDKVVVKHQGRTVYAGGDDVLAVFPAAHALDAATELCDLYKLSFAATKAASSATISGALIYAPFHAPLQELVRSGHQLLDDVAKDKTGRDALAISLVLGSGTNAVWSAPWSVVRGLQPGCPGLKTVLQRFSSQEKDPQGQPAFNSSFLYGLRQQFTKLLDLPINKPGSFGAADFASGADELLTDLAHAEYRRRLNKEQALKFTIEETRAQLSDLMWLSQRWYGDCEQVRCETQKFSFDGWRVARFLQQVNEGEVGEHG